MNQHLKLALILIVILFIMALVAPMLFREGHAASKSNIKRPSTADACVIEQRELALHSSIERTRLGTYIQVMCIYGWTSSYVLHETPAGLQSTKIMTTGRRGTHCICE